LNLDTNNRIAVFLRQR